MARQRKQRSESPFHEAGEDASIASPLRVVGGRFRGRRLNYHGDPRTRPMKERVRESVFNLLGPSVQGMQAIDLFAGTGALGLEALSRGAAKALLVEQHFPTAAVIRENAEMLGAFGQCEVITVNAFAWVRLLSRRARRIQPEGGGSEPIAPPPPWALPDHTAPWLGFVSPPYDFYLERGEEMLSLVNDLISASPDGSAFVVESDQRFDSNLLPFAGRWDIRAYPPAVVAIYRKA